MESQNPLTALEAAHNTLVMLCSTDEAMAQQYLAYLSKQDEPYLNAVRAMVYARTPFLAPLAGAAPDDRNTVKLKRAEFKEPGPRLSPFPVIGSSACTGRSP